MGGLVCLIFLEVCGGPFGSEESVQYGGPMLAILGFIVLPLLWSVPEALVTAELATAFPENSGYVVWVATAFGPFWGFLEGWFSWISGVTDNTIYPVVFISYIKLFWRGLDEKWWLEKSMLMLSSLLMTLLNWRGLDIVGQSSEIIVVLTLLPFVVLGVLALPHVKPSNWLQAKPLAEVDWSGFLNVMFWNLNYWDSVSTLAGEVRNPGKLFPRALGFGVLLVCTTYLMPLMVGIGVTTDTSADWTLGYYGHVAELVGGRWLAMAVLFAAAISQIGQFEAEMSSDSYQLLGMAERGYLPKAFAARSRYGTPVVGILLSSAGICTALFFSFIEIVELLNAIYCLAELMEFAAFIYLRVKKPEMHREFRVPLGVAGLLIMLLPASALLVTLLALPVILLRWRVIIYTFAVVFIGLFLYPLLQVTRRLNLVHFLPSELDSIRWSKAQLTLSMTPLPTFLCVVAMTQLTVWPLPLIAAAAIAAACALAASLWVVVGSELDKYEGRAGEPVWSPLGGSPRRGPSLGDGERRPAEAHNGGTPSIMDLNSPLLTPFLHVDADNASPNSKLPSIKTS